MGKLTDYSIVLMRHLALDPLAQYNAQILSAAVEVPLPTVRKVLKSLSHAGLLTSERGVQGGYSLSRAASTISVAEIITALEGPIALMECVGNDSHCEQESHCNVQDSWTKINNAVFQALDEVKLSDMLIPQRESTVQFYDSREAAEGKVLHG
jgi:FeS assembly SUF system regulator